MPAISTGAPAKFMNLSIPATLIADDPLPDSEIRRLIERVQRGRRGARQARESIIRHNIRMCWACAKRYAQPSQPIFEDLVAEGMIGLNTAIDKFDLARGVKFGTYAHYWVWQHIGRYVRNHEATIRIPVNTGQLKARRDAAELKFVTGQGRRPTNKELMKAARLTPRQLHRLDNLPVVISPESEEASDKLDHTILYAEARAAESEPTLDRGQVLKIVRGCLSERDARIVAMRFGLDGGKPHTLEHIAAAMHVTREGARQILIRASERLARNTTLKKLFDELE